MKEKKDSLKLWSLSFVLILCINALNGIATYMVNPSLPDYLLSKGAPLEYTGIISSLVSWIALVFRPFSGAVSDRFNKKRLMLISYAVLGICMFMYTFTDDLSVLIVIRLIHGIAFAVSGTVSMAFATSFIPIEKLGEGLGYLSLATLVSNVLGPQFGSMVSDAFGDQYVFSCASIFILFQTIVIICLKYNYERPIDNQQSYKFKFSDFFAKKLIPYMFLIGVFSFGNGIVSYYLKMFGESRGIANITLFFSVNSIAMVLSRPLAGKLLDRKGIKFILYPAYIITAVGIVILGSSYSLFPVLIAAALKAIGQGSGLPSIQTDAVRNLGKEKSGVAISTLFIGQDLGNAIGPVYASYVIGPFGYGVMFYGYAAMLIVADIFFHFYINRQQKKYNAAIEID